MTEALPCPVCSSARTTLWTTAKDYEYSSTTDRYRYYACADCDALFIDPVPSGLLSIIYPANYYSFVDSKRTLVHRAKEALDRRSFKKLFRSIAADRVNVLDIGGGTGWLSDLVRTVDNRVALTQIVDIDRHARALAESKGHRYFEGPIEKFETRDRFHLVLMLNLIEHVADPLALLQKAESLLAPGGIILVKTPNVRCWDARLFRRFYWGGLHAPRHWVLFSEQSFRLMVGGTGLRIDKLQYTQGAPFWAYSIIALLHRKGLVRITANRPIIEHPLYPLLSAPFAAFDFARSLFTKTAQMFIVLKKADSEQ
ncbi:MAG: bifunctional 3-demethylubiquinone-9 3-methyltransferase/2-octaprenyl-6-hydroxy phenol methylase [Flaviaesturariibacter sp.]|nr:bifunctional 3-demethylubiquinone-9 3-methyltransferase/2-octaprenyl-6-hydroxy phenol methylase [Flaviaesturariibacter sp.]